MPLYILGIESSCDDTAAAVIADDVILSNVAANQDIHSSFGGVVPELASRAHQQNIIPVIHAALQKANINKNQLAAVAYTRGPGLLGSLLVGASFSKAFALGLNIPLIEVDHLQAHILAHFIHNAEKSNPVPSFPFLCLTVSGGHTQIVIVKDHFNMHIIGQTIDDAAGETFDKAAKIMGLPYPGGPFIDKLAREGDPGRFSFAKPNIPALNFSFSGLKTSILYFLRDRIKENKDFIEQNKADPETNTKHAYHLFTILIDEQRAGISRDDFLKKINLDGIGVGVHYLSIPEHPFYQKTYKWLPENYPNSYKIGRQTVSLPLSPKLTQEQINRVIVSVCNIFSRK